MQPAFPTYFPSNPGDDGVAWKNWFDDPESWDYPQMTRLPAYIPYMDWYQQYLRLVDVCFASPDTP
jgi:hypothetical protein